MKQPDSPKKDEQKFFQNAFGRLPPVPINPFFKIRLRARLEKEYRSQFGHFQWPSFWRQPWLPWSLAAASLLALMFNFGFNMGAHYEKEVISSGEGLAFEQTAAGWRRLEKKDHSDSASFYVPPGSRSRIEHDLGTVIAADDCRLDFEGQQVVRVSSGMADFKPRKTLTVKTLQNSFKIEGQASLDLNSATPSFVVKRGRTLVFGSDGNTTELRSGQSFLIPKQPSWNRVSLNTSKEFLGHFKAGQVIKKLIPDVSMIKADTNLQARLVLAQRFSQTTDLVNAIRLLPHLKGDSREAAWAYIKSHSFEEVLSAQQQVNQEVPQNIELYDSLNRQYRIERADADLFRIEVEGQEPYFFTAREMLDVIPAEIISQLPSVWGMEASW